MLPLERSLLSLHGLTVGDAFGQTFFVPEDSALAMVQNRRPKPGPWLLTDDSIMACAVVEILQEHGEIECDALADRFAKNFRKEMTRGYGSGAIRALHQIGKGEDWRAVSQAMFEGQGSYGNGAAMRVAPVGAYFADDIDAVIEQATRSAVVTHAHPDAQAGAIAIAVATAWAWNQRSEAEPDGDEFLKFVHQHTPDSATRDGISMAQELGLDAERTSAIRALGNGCRLSSQDTVPLVLWISARNLRDYETGLWTAAACLGDRDTTCAMVGGILAAANGSESIPDAWIEAREPLTEWLRHP